MNIRFLAVKIIPVLAILFSNLFLLSGHFSAQAADLKSYNGSFSGELTPDGCRPGPPYMISGNIKDGRVKLVVMKGKSLDVIISKDGEFEGEAFLRPHKRGDKMQSYEGKVRGDKVIINATFGVPGYSQTECTAEGDMPLVN